MTIDAAGKRRIVEEFTERTGLPAPGSVGESALSLKEQRVRDLAFRGFLAELQDAGRTGGAKVTPINPERMVDPTKGESKFDGRVGDRFLLKGWWFRIASANDEGMFVKPEGPATRSARRRAARA